jgi:hypothetical protein
MSSLRKIPGVINLSARPGLSLVPILGLAANRRALPREGIPATVSWVPHRPWVRLNVLPGGVPAL